jgi:REP element-mobilizing transposase RayT
MPNIAISRVLQWLKCVTAKRAKHLLDLDQTKAFWQDESYDHWIRSEREMQKIIRYVEWNPVKAGLAKSVDEWPWSSAYGGRVKGSQMARPSAPQTPPNIE